MTTNNEVNIFKISEKIFSEILLKFKDTYLENRDLNDFNNVVNIGDRKNIFDWILKKYRIDLQNEYEDFIEVCNMDFDNFNIDSKSYYSEAFKYRIIYKSGEKIRFRNVLDNAKAIGNELANEYKDFDDPGDIIIQDNSDNSVVAIKKYIHRKFDKNEYNVLYFDVYAGDDIVIGSTGYYSEWIKII